MSHDNVLGIVPVLDGKMLDINMARPFSRDTVVDHIDNRHAVFKKTNMTDLWVSDFPEDSMHVSRVLGNCVYWLVNILVGRQVS